MPTSRAEELPCRIVHQALPARRSRVPARAFSTIVEPPLKRSTRFTGGRPPRAEIAGRRGQGADRRLSPNMPAPLPPPVSAHVPRTASSELLCWPERGAIAVPAPRGPDHTLPNSCQFTGEYRMSNRRVPVKMPAGSGQSARAAGRTASGPKRRRARSAAASAARIRVSPGSRES